MSTQHIGAKLTFLRILGGDGGRELISFISHHSTFNQNMMIEIGTYRVFQGFGQTDRQTQVERDEPRNLEFGLWFMDFGLLL